MPVIKVHLEDEEYEPVCRLARRLQVKPEDILHAGLDRVMLLCADPEVCQSITDLRLGRVENLPRWADSARSVHAYEAKQDGYAELTD